MRLIISGERWRRRSNEFVFVRGVCKLCSLCMAVNVCICVCMHVRLYMGYVCKLCMLCMQHIVAFLNRWQTASGTSRETRKFSKIINTCMCGNVSVYALEYQSESVYMYARMHACMYVHVCTNACMYVCTCMYVFNLWYTRPLGVRQLLPRGTQEKIV